MGRPKVRPEERRRAIQACGACKTTKRRCDGRRPCSRCINLDRTDLCRYRSQSRDGVLASVEHRSSACSDTPPVEDEGRIVGGLDSLSGPRPLREPGASDRASLGILNRDSKSLVPISGRMLSGIHGEKLYVGPSATLAFLQLLRPILSRYVGEMDNDKHNEGDTMVEAMPLQHEVPDLSDWTNPDQLREDIDSFFLATRGILNLFNKAELIQRVERLAAQGAQGIRNACATTFLAVAIGAQSRAVSALDARAARAYSVSVHRAPLHHLLSVPSVTSVTTSLLMAFYMLATHRRSATYMYIGVAARGAHALGMHHRSSYSSSDNREAKMRLRLWKSICLFDLMVCSILGRPSAVTIGGPTSLEAVAGGGNDFETCSIAFEASFQTGLITSDIMSRIYCEKDAAVQDAEHFMERLSQWRSSLPAELRRTISRQTRQTRPSRDGIGREEAAASMNMACFYYYAVMLVSRPFLVLSLSGRQGSLEQMSEARVSGLQGGITRSGTLDGLSRACVDSSVYMIETLDDASEADALLPNTTFIKAWVFAAALNLSFSMFFDPESSFEITKTFGLAVKFLRKMSDHSPHAKQYHAILQEMAALIQQRHDHIGQQRRQLNQHDIGRVSVGHNAHRDEEEKGDEQGVEDVMGTAPAGFEGLPLLDETAEELLENWDSVDMATLGPFFEPFLAS